MKSHSVRAIRHLTHQVILVLPMVVCTFFLQFAYAQSTSFRYKHLSVNDGLTQNSIWEICRDHSGYLWVGTADGLNRYNGQEVKQYKHQNGIAHSISGNTIIFIFEDTLKRIWVGNEGGIDIYDPIHDQFNAIYSYPGTKDAICRTKFILSEPDGKFIWLKLCNLGLYRFSVDRLGEYKKIDVPIIEDSLLHQELVFGSGIIDQTGYVSVGRKILLGYDFSHQTWKKYSFPQRTGYRFYNINQQLFYYENQELIEFIPETEVKRIRVKIPGFMNISDIISVRNYFLLVDENGYAFYNLKSGKVSCYQSFITDRIETYYRLATAYFDSQGILWIGTDGRGIYYTSMYENKFRLYQSENDDENMVKGICTVGENKLAIAAYNKGVLLYDIEKGTHKTFSGSKSFPGAENKKITSVCEAEGEKIWVSSTENNGNKLFLLDTKTGTGKNYSYLFNSPHAKQANGSINTWLVKNKDHLYALERNSIYKITKSDGTYKSQVFYRSRRANNTFIFFPKDTNFVLIGSNEDAIVLRKSDQREFLLKQNGLQMTKCITEDHEGNYYVGTTFGIYVFNHQFKLIKFYSNNSGLADNFTYGILCDLKGNIWVSHNKGLTRIQPKTGKSIHFNVKDGLQSNEFNTGAFFQHGNMLYFGGINGTNAFDPEQVELNPNQPQPAITGIRLFDEPLLTDTQPSLLKELSLNFDQNTLSFDFTALEFADVANNRFAYFMEGYDKNWIESGTKHFARYANLPPGNYIFKVKASNPDGLWSEQPTQLYIAIKPPFWQTTWFDVFITLLFLGFAAGLILLIYNRQQSKLRRDQELQQKLDSERMRISRDLHDHVGAQLSYLVTNIEWMKSHPDHLSPLEEIARLSALEEAGRHAILTLRQTIWAISQHELSIEEFADRFKQYAIRLIEFSSEIQVQFHEDLSDNPKLSPAVALNIFRICQEAFNNAVKHSGGKMIHVRFASSSRFYFRCMIEDDGRGFIYDATNHNGSYGLLNMKARSEENGAKLQIISQPGMGTIICIEIEKNTSNAV